MVTQNIIVVLLTGLGAIYLLVVLILLGRCSYYLGKILKELTLRRGRTVSAHNDSLSK